MHCYLFHVSLQGIDKRSAESLRRDWHSGKMRSLSRSCLELAGAGGGVLRMGDGVSPHVSEAAAGMEWGDCVVLGNNRQNEGPEIRHPHHMKHDEGIILLVEGFEKKCL